MYLGVVYFSVSNFLVIIEHHIVVFFLTPMEYVTGSKKTFVCVCVCVCAISLIIVNPTQE